jgi:hypothetical protein
MAMGKSDARSDLALRLHYQESEARREQQRNKEDVIMEWTLLSIVTLTSLLVGTLLHLIWKEKIHIPQIRG